jgi:WD40-like Beta Propeller Repeat
MTYVRKSALTMLLLSSLTATSTAQGAFPGTNGAIAYVVRSPTGRRVIERAFLGPEGTLVASSPALTETPVDEVGESFNPAWSPDGRDLAFVGTRSGRRQIYKVTLGLAGNSPLPCGAHACQLTAGAAESYEPAWSYDGGSIVFVGTASGTPQLYMMSATGEDVRRLTFDGATDEHPAWSRSGEIAFVSNASGSPQIYLMNGQGGELRQLTHSGVHITPTWSPSGTELSYQGQTPTGMELFTLDEPILQQSLPQALSYPTPESSQPAFSPDGMQLLVARGPEAAGDVRLELLSSPVGLPLRRSLAVGEDADWAPLPMVAPTSAPTVVAGVTAVASPLSGDVSVNAGHSSLTTPPHEGTATTSSLTQTVEVPVDATYDTTHGVVKLTVAGPATGGNATAVVGGGRFLLTQQSATATPSIRLLGSPRSCHHTHGRALAASNRPHGPSAHGHSHGHWHEAGNYGKSSSESTRWEIENTCAGTIYRAIEDTLEITDPHRRRPIRLTAGHSYLVRPGR